MSTLINESPIIKDLLQKTYRLAKLESTDPSTQNTALLIDNLENRNILAMGANHFPRGVIETTERWERPLKYKYVEHAERNCVYAAASIGVATKGTVMVCPWFACAGCARGIIQSGIKEVIGHQPTIDLTPDRWKESIEEGLYMLREGGVKYSFYEGKIFDPSEDFFIVFNEDLFYP